MDSTTVGAELGLDVDGARLEPGTIEIEGALDDDGSADLPPVGLIDDEGERLIDGNQDGAILVEGCGDRVGAEVGHICSPHVFASVRVTAASSPTQNVQASEHVHSWQQSPQRNSTTYSDPYVEQDVILDSSTSTTFASTDCTSPVAKHNGAKTSNNKGELYGFSNLYRMKLLPGLTSPSTGPYSAVISFNLSNENVPLSISSEASSVKKTRI